MSGRFKSPSERASSVGSVWYRFYLGTGCFSTTPSRNVNLEPNSKWFVPTLLFAPFKGSVKTDLNPSQDVSAISLSNWDTYTVFQVQERDYKCTGAKCGCSTKCSRQAELIALFVIRFSRGATPLPSSIIYSMRTSVFCVYLDLVMANFLRSFF